MKVILREDVQKLGKPGDVVNVSDGFARNFLLPQKKALVATQENLKNLEYHQKQIIKRLEKEKTQSEELAKRLSEVSCVVTKKVGKNDKLFGSVTSQDIHQVLAKQGFSLDRRSIALLEPIKSLGNHEISIKLPSQVTVSLKVEVRSEK